MAPQLPAGWYPDQRSNTHERYWDGSEWTRKTRRGSPNGSPRRRTILAITIPVVAVALAVAIAGGVALWLDRDTSSVVAVATPTPTSSPEEKEGGVCCRNR